MSNFCSFEVGEEVTNNQIINEFKCANMGGMRRSKATNSLMLVSDHTKSIYEDRWYDDIIHYTGMGKSGDQKIDFSQNKTLARSSENTIEVHLFEVLEAAKYIYRGQVKLSDTPYQEIQKGEDGKERLVWIFPLKLIANNPNLSINMIEKKQDKKEKKARLLSDKELKDRILQKNNGISSRRNVNSIIYERDVYIAEYVKRYARGRCQLCNNFAPFNKPNGEPYLECHHIEPLADGGNDSIDNIVALCPNCHRKMHSLNLENDLLILKEKVNTRSFDVLINNT